MQTIYIIRHGDRYDYEIGRTKWLEECGAHEHDPPLSTLGKQQAIETSTAIREMTTNETIHHILVSPFVRCIQTAAPIADSLGMEINLEHSLWEGVVPYHTLEPHAIRELSIINQNYISTFCPRLNEKFPYDSLVRCCRLKKELIETRFENENIILVTHAATVVGLAAALLQCKISDISPAYPTSIYKFTREHGCSQWRSVEQANVSHLSALGDTYSWPHSNGLGKEFINAGDNLDWLQ
jgi:transcription factor C subunit 7